MTRQFFLRFLLIASFLGFNFNATPSLRNSSGATGKAGKNIVITVVVDESPTEACFSIVPIKKTGFLEELSIKKVEELAKIHRFHKDRVKNNKKHGHKFWIFSKFLLIICHAIILICAFLDLVH